MDKIVRVYVYGGVVQNIQVPRGVRVELFDGDVEGVDEDDLDTNPFGEPCQSSTWYSDGANVSGTGKRD